MLLGGTTAVAVQGRALLIEGNPGSGKSSLALALIDRGAVLIGDDGVLLTRRGAALLATPPPRIEGLLEIRGVGLARVPTASAAAALILRLDPGADRFPEEAARRELLGVAVPVLPFRAGDAVQALRAEYALRMHGLAD